MIKFEEKYDPKNILFLDKTINILEEGYKVAIQSYPRTGNSMMRIYLQNILGVATGSDM